NASDFRNAEAIHSIVGSAAKQMSLFSKGKIILIDEIDGISGTKDRGGIPELISIIETSAFPVICTGIDMFDSKFSALRKKALMIEFEAPSAQIIFDILAHICSIEKIQYEEATLKQLARQSGGDVRAAITDLQILSYDKKLIKEDVETLSSRNRQESIPSALVKVFKATDLSIALSAFESVDEDLPELMLWIDENLPLEYKKPEDLARAYHYLSQADIFNRRIRRWQHWRFLAYVSSFLSGGVAVAKDEKYKEFIQYKPTNRILKLWMANQKYAKRKTIAEKIHERLHTSQKETIKSTIPYLQVIFKNNVEMGKKIAHELELDEEQVEWLRK
ncbi:MAG TPA: replication factor C large subunit, partial [Candidatus Nanoarchaeia archaeon]|nr:replication factor C large subunit [Candidatus Nanoarchaeia archaeon]